MHLKLIEEAKEEAPKGELGVVKPMRHKSKRRISIDRKNSYFFRKT